MINITTVIGNKYFRQNDDGEVTDIVRIYRYDHDDTVSVYNDISKSNVRRMSLSELNRDWTLLKPHAILVFCSVKCGNNLEDVIVCMHRYKDILAGNNEPYCVLRQNITDLFSHIVITSTRTFTGCCVSIDTCPEGVDYSIMTACNSVEKNVFVATYMDDSIDDILKLIKTKYFDIILESLFTDHINYECGNTPILKSAKSMLKQRESFDGYCKSLRTLMEENNFMYDFYRAFNIIPVNFKIDVYDDGAVCEKAIQVIESVKMVNIIATMAVKYWYDIDFNDIQNDYCLIMDSEHVLYVIAYRYSGRKHINLEDVESEQNILKLANDPVSSKNKSVQEALNNIRLNKNKYINK